jgi:hypothetical protein
VVRNLRTALAGSLEAVFESGGQAATGTTPQALSAMNAMIQLNVVALRHLYAAEQW